MRHVKNTSDVSGGGGPIVIVPGNMILNETPSGAVDGSNATFTVVGTFTPGDECVFYNGILQKGGVDYNTSGADTVIFTFSPKIGSTITMNYKTP